MRSYNDQDLLTVKAQVCQRLGRPNEPTRDVIVKEMLGRPGIFHAEVRNEEKFATEIYRFVPDGDEPIDIGPKEDWELVGMVPWESQR